MKPEASIVERVGRLQSQLDDEAVQPVHPILEARERGIVRPHVLEEQQTAAGLEDSPDLADGACLVVDAAEHERRDNGVEAFVLERKILGGGAQDLAREAPARAPSTAAGGASTDPAR